MMNSELYNIVSENELTEVIAHFNTEFIMSIIDSAINARFNPNAYMMTPNVVDAWDMNFKQICEYYQSTDMTERMATLRVDTYKEIIDRICKYHSLNFTIEDVDLYSAARYLYQFFVCGFLQYMNYFFASYIVHEADSIYDAMQLETQRKRKDTSTIYTKRVFKNDKLAIIVANIDSVITYIGGMDFDFSYIVSNSGLTMQEVNYILSLVSPQDDFFKTQYMKVMNDQFVRPVNLNNIRFIIRTLSDPDDEIYSVLANNSTDQIDPMV